jgi:hypothetical protein
MLDYNLAFGGARAPPAGVRPRRGRAAEILDLFQEVCFP